MANLVVAQLLFLEAENPEKDIHLYIQLAGWFGDCRDVHLRHHAVHQAQRLDHLYRPGVQHGCPAACGRCRRQALLPAAFADDDPPAAGRFQGQASDIEIHAKEILFIKERLRPDPGAPHRPALDVIARDTDRDRFMSGDEAVKYGLIDKVMTQRDLAV